MFELLNKLMNAVKENMGSNILEQDFNLSVTQVEEEIKRLARLSTYAIESSIRSEVENFTDTLVDLSTYDSEHHFSEQNELFTTRINALLKVLSDERNASSFSSKASAPHSTSATASGIIPHTTPRPMSSGGEEQFEQATGSGIDSDTLASSCEQSSKSPVEAVEKMTGGKKAGGDEAKSFLRRQGRYTIDLPSSVHAFNETHDSSSREKFRSTPIYLPLNDQQRREMQDIFSCLEEILQANNLEGMIEVGPVFSEHMISILEENKDRYDIFISRMIHIQAQANLEKETTLCVFLDNFKDKMQDRSNPLKLSIKIPLGTDYAEENSGDWKRQSRAARDHADVVERERFQRRQASASSSSIKNAMSVGLPFYRPSKHDVILRIKELPSPIFDSWVKPLRDLLDIFAPPTTCAVAVDASSAAVCLEDHAVDIEINFSAHYLSFFIDQLYSIRDGRLVIESVSDLDGLILLIHNHFYESLAGQLDKDQLHLINAELLGEQGDSIISDALSQFKSLGEEACMLGQFSECSSGRDYT